MWKFPYMEIYECKQENSYSESLQAKIFFQTYMHTHTYTHTHAQTHTVGRHGNPQREYMSVYIVEVHEYTEEHAHVTAEDFVARLTVAMAILWASHSAGSGREMVSEGCKGESWRGCLHRAADVRSGCARDAGNLWLIFSLWT